MDWGVGVPKMVGLGTWDCISLGLAVAGTMEVLVGVGVGAEVTAAVGIVVGVGKGTTLVAGGIWVSVDLGLGVDPDPPQARPAIVRTSRALVIPIPAVGNIRRESASHPFSSRRGRRGVSVASKYR